MGTESRLPFKIFSTLIYVMKTLELVSKELNHLAALLHVYAGGLIFMKKKINVIIFQKENGITFTLLIIFIVKSLQNSTNLLL